jgi:hypothetical protein
MWKRYVGGKEQIEAMLERNIIYTRNGDVVGKEQIIAVMERNMIYMRNGDVGAKEQKYSGHRTKKYHLYEEQIVYGVNNKL